MRRNHKIQGIDEKMKGVLVSGGNRVSPNIMKKYCLGAYIVCADCGIKNFYDLDFYPDLVVGDFDSIDDKGREFILKNNILIEKFPAKKNLTDTELALNYILERECSDITVLAATGTRLDHTMANIFMLEYMHELEKNSRLVDNNNEIEYMTQEKRILYKDDYKYISIISITDEVVYSTVGMEYETNHLSIDRFSARGVSNVILNEYAEIEIHKGSALIIKSRD